MNKYTYLTIIKRLVTMMPAVPVYIMYYICRYIAREREKEKERDAEEKMETEGRERKRERERERDSDQKWCSCSVHFFSPPLVSLKVSFFKSES
jgi:hypothetical protein